MRKPILLASFALFTTLSAFPMKEIAGEFQPWDANCQILGKQCCIYDRVERCNLQVLRQRRMRV